MNMNTLKFIAGISFAVLFCNGLLHAEDNASKVFDVPRVEGITIDGKGDDWGDRGFRVNIMPDDSGKLKPANHFDATFRLGWDDRGLLLLVNVIDDTIDEAKTTEIWYGDSVELFYSPKRGSGDVVQMVISPGVDPKTPEMRSNLNDERTTESLKKIKVTATVARTKTPGGYMLEGLLPWENFAIKPEPGREVAFQIYVNDADNGSHFQARWYPFGQGHESANMQTLRLSDKAGPAINTSVTAEYEHFRRVVVHVAGTTDLAGKTCVVKEGDNEAGTGTLSADAGRAGAKIVLPMPPVGKSYGPLSLAVEGQPPQPIILPDVQGERAKAFTYEDLSFTPNVFSGMNFPQCEFERPGYVEDLIGPYTLSATYYDSDYNEVKTAQKPGRYGAVVEIKTADGKTYRRLRTLFRAPGKTSWWETTMSGSVEFPKEMGIDPGTAAHQKESTGKYLKQLVAGSLSHDNTQSMTPALLSALYTTKPGAPDATVFDDFQAQDRQWWVGLKRKLNGADKTYPAPFVCPEVIKGKLATVLHKGTLKEAGMKEGTVEKLDAVLKEWAATSNEPFGVCVARHGVIVIHKAYGTRDGKPLTVDTKSWLASITKSLSGSLMMMLVDQGLVNLDDPVSKFLPGVQAGGAEGPLTIRHLYTHSGGFMGYWSDDLNDLEEIIAGYAPYLPVGERFAYNGSDVALGSKIIEKITGESLPQFYKHHLLDPLGCAHTEVTNSSGDAQSIPMDLAKFAQMLLNKGSYGDKQFMKPETFQQMIPERLVKTLGPDTSAEWGIGLVWCKTDGLSNTTMGHGSSSSSTLRIDPEHDLVITMTRNAPGRGFTEYNKKFFAAIMENIAE